MSDDEHRLTWHRDRWAVTWHDPARRTPPRISTGTADRREAEVIARAIFLRATAAKSERVKDLWPVYVRDRKRDGVQTERFPPIWKALGPHFGERIGSDISREDCRAYHKARTADGASASTVHTELALLRACLRNYYGAEGAPTLWLPPPSSPRDKWLTKDQARLIIDSAHTPHVKLFVILGLTTGARASAILDLTWDRVDFDHGTIDYRPAGRKTTNKRRTVVPMNTTAREALVEAYKARLSDHVIEYGGKPVKSIKKGIQRLSARTGIQFSPHVLRHTCAVWMAQADVPMQKISQYLGHTSSRITETVYARYSPSYMQDASSATVL